MIMTAERIRPDFMGAVAFDERYGKTTNLTNHQDDFQRRSIWS